MADPGNQYCANCIGTLSFPNGVRTLRHIDRLKRILTISGEVGAGDVDIVDVVLVAEVDRPPGIRLIFGA